METIVLTLATTVAVACLALLYRQYRNDLATAARRERLDALRRL